MTEEVKNLLEEVTRQTIEMKYHKDRIVELGAKRRELFIALQQNRVTIPKMAAATGLHKMTIQQDMQRYRREKEVLKGA